MKMTTTTLEILNALSFTNINLTKLLRSLRKTNPDNEPVSLEYILNSNGIHDAVWALQLLEYKTYCLFLADIAKKVLPLFQGKNKYYKERKYNHKEKKYNEEDYNYTLALELIESIESHHVGEISEEKLKEVEEGVKKELCLYCDYLLTNCITLFASTAYRKEMSPYFVIYTAMDVDPDLKWEAIELIFRKHFSQYHSFLTIR